MLESGQLAIAMTTLELKHIISGNGFKLGFNVTGSCHVSQESVEAKRKLNRGMTNQIQRWHVVSTESMSSWLPERKHTKYPGTNRGNCIGWIGLGSQADEWTMTYGQKTFGN